jgi:hypothetical protein
MIYQQVVLLKAAVEYGLIPLAVKSDFSGVKRKVYVERVLPGMAAGGHSDPRRGAPGKHHLPGRCHVFSSQAGL